MGTLPGVCSSSEVVRWLIGATPRIIPASTPSEFPTEKGSTGNVIGYLR